MGIHSLSLTISYPQLMLSDPLIVAIVMSMKNRIANDDEIYNLNFALCPDTTLMSQGFHTLEPECHALQ